MVSSVPDFPSALDFLTRQHALEPAAPAALEPADPAARPNPQPAPPDAALARPGPSVGTSARGPTLADFLGTLTPSREATPPMHEVPSLTGITQLVLNFATTGLDWRGGDRPIGVTVGTLDGQLLRFLPFAFAGGNHDEAAIIRFLQHEVRGKHLLNTHTVFDLHMARVLGVDLEAQGNTFSDIQHTAALLDDHRRQFKLDKLAADYLPHEELIARLDETSHADYHADDVAMRELFTVYLVGELHAVMAPQIAAQRLERVQALEDAVIPVVAEMERNGSPLNLPLLEQMHADCTAQYGALMREIVDEAGFAFEHTPTGWTKLFEKCGLPPAESYAEDITTAVDHPLIRKAHAASQLANLDSKTFAAYPKHVRNGVLYYDIKQLRGEDGGTVSGRFSIGLVQQVPNHDNHHVVFGRGDVDACDGGCPLFPRRLFASGNGDYLEADAAQIEYRLFADLANNPRVIQAYRDNPQLSYHKQTWEMFKVHLPTMLYTEQKRFNFAKQYGARTIKLGVMMGVISAKEGEEIRAAKRWTDPRLARVTEIETIYKQVLPEGEFLLELSAHLAKPACDGYCKRGDRLHRDFAHQGYVETILGRRSRFPDNYKTYIGLNRRLQGSASDIMKAKLVELHRERAHTGFLMRITVHDQAGGDAQQPETKARVAEILNRQSFDLKVPIVWGVKTGPDWARCA